MITGMWMNEDDQMRLAVQIHEETMVIVDFRFDPPMCADPDDLGVHVGSDWVEVSPTNHDGCIPVEQA